VSLYGAASCEVCPASFGDYPCQFPVCGPSISEAFLRDEGMNVNASNRCVVGAFDPLQSTTFFHLPATPDAGNSFTTGAYACNTANSARTRCQACAQYGSESGQNCGQGFAGDLGVDVISVGGLRANVSFVTITLTQAGFQESPAAGIMGVAFQSLNALAANPTQFSNGGPTTTQPVSVDLLLSANGRSNAFSMCMGSPSNPGTFVLGGENPAYRTSAMSRVPLDSSQGYYGISVGFLSIGPSASVNSVSDGDAQSLFNRSAQQSAFVASSAIVDSGTPQLSLPSTFGDVLDSWPDEATACATNNDCVVGIHLSNGVNLTVPGVFDCTQGQCAPNGWVTTGGTNAIIGYAVMRNYYILFNRDPADQYYGFAPASEACSQGANVQPPGRGSSSPRSKLSASDDIGIGVGVAVAVLLSVVVGLYVCKAKQASAQRAPRSMGNPAYTPATWNTQDLDHPLIDEQVY
jgi:hypothetical protein